MLLRNKDYKYVSMDQYAWKSELSYIVLWKRFYRISKKSVEQLVGFME
jgi:hypothetical protein